MRIWARMFFKEMQYTAFILVVLVQGKEECPFSLYLI